MAFWKRRVRAAPNSIHVDHDEVCIRLENHVRGFFDGRQVDSLTWPYGPLARTNAHFHVLRIAPTDPGGLWVYVSIGGWAWGTHTDRGLEFIIATDHETDRAVELLAMNVWYNRDSALGVGHTVPNGEPWLPGSACDHWVISLPYPWGPDLEVAHVGDRHVDFVWMLPITKAECDFKVEFGLEALEQHFEDAELEYWDATRTSLV
jgi:hypothetical protein